MKKELENLFSSTALKEKAAPPHSDNYPSEQKPTVLMIQARKSEARIQREQEILQSFAEKKGVSLVFINPLTEAQHPWDDPKKMLQETSGVIFGGSADVDLTLSTNERDVYLQRVTGLARESMKRGSKWVNPMPVFGICVGHQMLHQTGNGRVERNAEQVEKGTGRIILTKRGRRDPLLADIVLSEDSEGKVGFLVNFAHNETVVKPARGFKRLGSTDRNKFSLMRKRAIFTTQGHPELLEADDLKKVLGEPKMYEEQLGRAVPMLSTPGTAKLLENFFATVAKTAEKQKTYQPLAQKVG
jgi:GMP synthase-like glutamine amidotransferase